MVFKFVIKIGVIFDPYNQGTMQEISGKSFFFQKAKYKI